jgi:serine/threonine protein kinase
VEPTCDAPADLTVVLGAALALEPGDRTQSASEFGRALAAVREAHPERTPSPLFEGRYERLAVMGTGAKGDVFWATHRGSSHDVALKFLRSTTIDDMHRFQREAKLLAMFEHPCIPRFYDYVPDGEPPYIIMARAPGVPAANLCLPSDAARLTPIEVAQIGWQIAEALAYIHERGVLHRDINANNVLIELPGTPRINRSERVQVQRTPRVTLIDPVPWLCTDFCPPVIGNVLAYRDSNHLTTTYARTVAPLLDAALPE